MRKREFVRRDEYEAALRVAAGLHNPETRKLMLTGICRRARWSGMFTSQQVGKMKERAVLAARRLG